MVKARVSLPGFRQHMWKEEHDETIGKFISEPNTRLLIFHIDPIFGFVVATTIPNYVVDKLMYFMKGESTVVTAENFHKAVQYGAAGSKNPLDSVLRFLHCFYGPTVFTNESWPDDFRNGFSVHVHRFMSTLTDYKYKMTVLYIPDEGPKMCQPNAHKMKELVFRLEGS